MIAYKIQTDGRAIDLRFVNSIEPGDIAIEGDVIPDIHTLHSLSYIKNLKISAVKAEASKKIDVTLPDWQVRRHHDQVELGVATTLTTANYTAKQQTCQAIRDASNTIETEIQVSSDPNSIDIANHTAWPV
ncbi:MAG: hypothetical protein FD156_1241 [Nitrospirae bacterium]|nr:MAG: hypothetical protein FD156_1241 [Nitrospirota bacterium]